MKLPGPLLFATWLIALLTGFVIALGYADRVDDAEGGALALLFVALVVAANVGLVHAAWRAGVRSGAARNTEAER